MSELRSAARRLVEPRHQSFESDYTVDESERRVAAALERLPAQDRDFHRAWSGGDGDPAMLTATFPASPAMQRALKLLSVAMALLLAGAAASWFLAGDAVAWMLTITAALAFLGFPLVIVGLASRQDAREARIARALRAALGTDPGGGTPAGVPRQP